MSTKQIIALSILIILVLLIAGVGVWYSLTSENDMGGTADIPQQQLQPPIPPPNYNIPPPQQPSYPSQQPTPPISPGPVEESLTYNKMPGMMTWKGGFKALKYIKNSTNPDIEQVKSMCTNNDKCIAFSQNRDNVVLHSTMTDGKPKDPSGGSIWVNNRSPFFNGYNYA